MASGEVLTGALMEVVAVGPVAVAPKPHPVITVPTPATRTTIEALTITTG